MKYIKELDSVRAIAILLVIVGHWSTQGSIAQKIFDADFGVNIFFVLSGFLITWILLSNRETAATNGSSRLQTFGNFYVRRTLRIFPIYYLCVFFFFFFPGTLVEDKEHIYPWLFTYTSNLFFFIYQKWDGHISHLWSLAVEEQFYLLWPAFMLFVHKKHLRYLIYFFIAISICCQVLFRGLPMVNYFTVSCFSAFGIGALLAYYIVYEPTKLENFFLRLRIPVIVSIGLFIAGIFQQRWPSMPLQRVFHSILAVFLIAFIILKRYETKTWIRRILQNRVLVFVGKISYGLYLYHGFLPFVFSDLVFKFFQTRPEEVWHPLLWFIVKLVIVVFVSWISWILIERPILRLKRYFEYSEKKKADVSAHQGVLE